MVGRSNGRFAWRASAKSSFMQAYELTHLSDEHLLRNLAALLARHRQTTVALLAHIAEVDRRRLYAPAGYPSMFAYCVSGLHLSEDAAAKRIHAARAARSYPALFTAMADGKIHLAAACLLAPHLNPDNVDELLAESIHRSKSELEQFLARRFPREDLPTRRPVIRALPASRETQTLRGVPERLRSVESPGLFPAVPLATSTSETSSMPLEQRQEGSAPQPNKEHAPEYVETSESSRRDPKPRERFLLRVTIGRRVHDKLRYAQALLSHSVRSGDVEALLERSLDALIAHQERRRLGRSLSR
jgi:hypothetical protein